MFEKSKLINYLIELTKDNRINWIKEDGWFITTLNEDGIDTTIKVRNLESIGIIGILRGNEIEEIRVKSPMKLNELNDAIMKVENRSKGTNKKLLKNVIVDLNKRSKG